MKDKKERIIIHCYKHNGQLHKTWQDAFVLEKTKDKIVLGNCQALVTKVDGKTWYTKEPAILFYYPNKWYNIIAQLKEHGLFYYCNITSPFIIEDNIIKYIDYDLDLRVFPDGGFKVLDRNEYRYHKRLMKYSKELDMVIKHSLTELINLKRSNSGPFDKEVISYYYNIYKKIQNNSNK